VVREAQKVENRCDTGLSIIKYQQGFQLSRPPHNSGILPSHPQSHFFWVWNPSGSVY